LPFVGAQVPAELKARFDALAMTEGGKSALLRRMLESVTGQGPAARPTALAAGTSDKVTVRFRRSEQAAIADAAAARGMTRTAWIASLVRARLGLGLPLTGGEEEALRAIARELHRIGGNINQMARASNTQALSGKPVELDADALTEAAQAVREATCELRQVLGRSAGAWQVPV
jgi:hypothetical protein